MLVELMRNTRKRVKLARHPGIAQQLEKTLAAFGRDRNIGESMKQYGRRKCFRNVRCRTGRTICRFVAAGGHESRRERFRVNHRNRVKRDTRCKVRSGFWRSTIAFELRAVSCSGSEQSKVSACRVTHHSDSFRIDSQRAGIG